MVAGVAGFETREEIFLLAGEGFVDLEVALDTCIEGSRAQGLEALVEVGAELAEVLVVGVSEGKNAVAEVCELWCGVTRELLEKQTGDGR